eukprot:gnl/MRDRNA2_/MRDRNA2_56065_c0_seq1.p1 gnl/MRDRNA2_/MRDRNA2_56065_c0~~gnl/MRDRNA2_/MRDRNA2_56065_c0_seq1.p1  ORF type:complete len:152 (+),score=57.29 gnl/MRDRNA2_/MRDRNA2_56065_c0_seq1:127-582(+)
MRGLFALAAVLNLVDLGPAFLVAADVDADLEEAADYVIGEEDEAADYEDVDPETMMKELDQNFDQKLSFDEVIPPEEFDDEERKAFKQMFDESDANKDGEIDTAELPSMVERFNSLHKEAVQAEEDDFIAGDEPDKDDEDDGPVLGEDEEM